MTPLEIAKLICVIVIMVCGAGLFIIWRVWPSHDAVSGSGGVTVLKAVAAGLFLAALFMEFALQLIGLF